MHDCPCCGDDVVYSDDPDELCRGCEAAGCEPNDNKNSDNFGIYDACQIPQCEECCVPCSFMTDEKWHYNCEPEECARKREEDRRKEFAHG